MLLSFAAIGLAILIWVWRAGTKSAENQLGESGAVGRALAHLRDRGVDKSEVRFQLRNDASRAVLFKKRIVARNIIQLQGMLCDNHVSREAYDAVKAALESRRIPYTAVALDGHQCLVMNATGDIADAERFVVAVFEAGFNADIARDGVAYSKNTLVVKAPWITGVDS